MRQRLLILVMAIAASVGGGVAVSAQELPPYQKPPSQWSCAACPQGDDRLREIQDEQSTLRDRLDNIRSNQAALAQSMGKSAAEIVSNTAGVAVGTPGAADALAKANSRLQDAAGQLRRLDEARDRTNDELTKKSQEASQLREGQDACRKECPEVHAPANTTGGPPPATSSSSTTPATPPAVCNDCTRRATLLRAAEEALAALQEELTLKLLQTAALGLEVRDRINQLRTDPGVNVEQAINSIQTATDFIEDLNTETTKLQEAIPKLKTEVDARRQSSEECDETCAPPSPPISRSYLKPLTITAGAVVAVGTLVLGGSDSPPTVSTGQSPNTTPNAPVVQTPDPAPAPAPPQASCAESSGTYSFAGTLRTPRTCFFTGTVPYFQSPISGTFVLQLDASCSGTLTTRHPNSWTFMHRVTGTLNGTTLQLRSTGSFSSTQPFGTPFSSMVELVKANNTYSGTETHTSGGCTDVYDLRDNR